MTRKYPSLHIKRTLVRRADNYSKDVDDVAYEVDCEMIIVKEGDVDIGMSPWLVEPWREADKNRRKPFR